MRMGSPWFVLASISFVIRAATVGAYLLWIKQWTDSDVLGNATRPWVTGIAALCLLDVLFGCLGALFLALGFRRVSSQMHREMVRRVLSSPVRFFDATPRGRVLNRFSTDLDNVDTRLFLAAKQVMQALPVAVAKITVTGLQSMTAGLLGAFAAAIFVVFMVYLAKASNAARRLESVEYSRLLQHVTETRDTMTVVRSYRVERRFCGHCYRLIDATIRALITYIYIIRTVRFSGGLSGIVTISATLASMMLTARPSPSAAYEGSTIGLALSSSMGIPLLIMAVSSGVFLFFQTFVSFERCLEYTRLPPENGASWYENPEEGKKGTARNFSATIPYAPALDKGDWPSKGKLHFDGYTASYLPGVLPDVLVNVSFRVDSREKDTCLMRGPLREVLDPTCTCSDEEVRQALVKVHLTDLVAQHPNSIFMEVGEGGSNLSAGQRQLVCLARALLRKPRILVLDEATSHMDGDTDRLIQRTLREGFSECTMLTIAHRLDTVLDYDKILVMDGGHVAEFGPTLELASNPCSRFHTMLNRAGLTAEDVRVVSEPANTVGTHL
ncbi:ATP-binding cassette sub-family C member 2-like [Dermacentor variabilis]|uniref:ATP-binding cassette sub-family C member 2-like n=1 Tax=Dermacentor variabilis TaxID=34621 RepID=UPI003F5C5E4C